MMAKNITRAIKSAKIELTQLYASLGQLEIQIANMQAQKNAIASEIIQKINYLAQLEK